MSLAEYRQLISRRREESDQNTKSIRILNLSQPQTHYKIAETDELKDDLSFVPGGEETTREMEEQLAGLENYSLGSLSEMYSSVDYSQVDGGYPLHLRPL